MKVLFIVRDTYYEPLGVMSLISFLKSHGHEADLLIVTFEKNIIGSIKNFKPDVIGYSVCTGAHTQLLELNKRIKKELDVFSIFGGPHPTFFNEMIEEEGVDAICIGEGEGALLELVNNLEGKKDITKIENLMVKNNGRIYKNSLRNLIQDLDALPFLDRDCIYKYKFFRVQRNKSFITSRGCPYNCSYCFNHQYRKLYEDKGAMIRRRSVDNVIREIKKVREKYKIEKVGFFDDIFTLDRKWIEEFCEKYKKEIGMPFIILSRPDLLNEKIVKQLRDAGLFAVGIGIEAGDDHIRNNLLRRNLTKGQIVQACRLIKRHNILVYAFNMIGVPNENMMTMYETLKLNIKCKVDIAVPFLFQPYPKTEIWRYCVENGLFDGNFDGISDAIFTEYSLKSKYRREFINFSHLFYILVKHPALIPLSRALIRLPANRIFNLAGRLFRKAQYKSLGFK